MTTLDNTMFVTVSDWLQARVDRFVGHWRKQCSADLRCHTGMILSETDIITATSAINNGRSDDSAYVNICSKVYYCLHAPAYSKTTVLKTTNIMESAVTKNRT